MEKKKDISLIVGLAIPVLMILFVTASIYLPYIFSSKKPQYNFLYYAGDYYWGKKYIVRNGKLELREYENQSLKSKVKDPPPLCIYNVQTDTNTEISLKEAEQLRLNPNAESPDGFEIAFGSHSDGLLPLLLYSRSDYGSVYIKGHGKATKLKINPRGNEWHYYPKFQFLGWIER